MRRRRWSGPAFLVASLFLGWLLAGCAPAGDESPRSAVGAETVTLAAGDGVLLDARYWRREGERIVIYLHEYRADQSAWWSWAAAQRETSSLTLDLRGHGATEQLEVDVTRMVADVDAAIAFAREEGYAQVMLVGAGMSGAVAITAAADDPHVTVLGLAAPVEFGELRPIEVIDQTPGLASRIWLIASRDDVSAADSLHQFREVAGVPYSQSRLFAGRAHGIALLEGVDGTAARRLTEQILREFWVADR